MGRRPFAGRYLGPDPMPISRAIKECRFAYGARRANVLIENPPGTPALSIVGDKIGFMFEPAFAREMLAGGRPLPRDWIEGLERLEKTLKPCSANPSHWHRDDTAWPWCPMKRATDVQLCSRHAGNRRVGPRYRSALAPTRSASPSWRAARNQCSRGSSFSGRAISRGCQSQLQGRRERCCRDHDRRLRTCWIARVRYPLCCSLAALARSFGLLRLLDKSEEVRNFEVTNNAASASWTDIQQQWGERTSPGPFEQKKAELMNARRALSDVPDLRLRKLDQLRQNQHAIQLTAFLDQYEIQRAKISGVGPGRK